MKNSSTIETGKDATKKIQPDAFTLVDLIDALVERKTEFFLNSALRPTLRLPDDRFQKEWRAESTRVGDLLNKIYYLNTNGKILQRAERDFVVSQIRELCREGGQRFSHTESEKSDEDAIVQGVLDLMNHDKLFDDRTAVLKWRLAKAQSQDKFTRREDIPKSTNIFSRRLKHLIPTLRGYGLEVAIHHKQDGSHCKISRLEHFAIEPDLDQGQMLYDDSDFESSVEPSGEKPKRGKELQTADGSDENIRFDPPALKPTIAPSKPPTVVTQAKQR